MKETAVLPIIEVDGVKIKPQNRGFYKRPFCRSGKRFPAPTWKTEKGFRKHLDSCQGRPSVISAQRKRWEEAKELALSKVTQKIGDRIFYVCEVIVKPTHVQRGNRIVHVRYEPEKRFCSGETAISSIDYDYEVFFNNGIRVGDLVGSLEEAEQKAKARQAAWDESVRHAEMCR